MTKTTRCKKVSFSTHTKEDARYILAYTLGNQAPHPDEKILRQQLNKIFQERAGYLFPRHKAILFMYFGINEQEQSYSYQGVGDHYGITRERVRQIVQKSLRILMHPKHNQHFRDFL